MKTFTLLLITALAFSACEKNKDAASGTFPNGAYTGTFSRTGMDTANVMINLFNDKFDGSSNIDKYPAICHGSFATDDQTITFIDSCTWTADFDWTLILNGTYNISFINNLQIRIWRTNGTVTDEYLLRKLVR